MTKHLLFYWYANRDDFMNRFSLLHLHALNLYKDIFDKKTFIVSMDNPDTDMALYIYTVKLISAIVPDAEFIKVQNDPVYASEAWWIKQEFIPNMSEYKDETVFWCHGKGKGGLKYNDRNDLYLWIAALYYMNLENKVNLENFVSDDNAYMMGSLYYPLRAWTFSNWHYNGGFYWIKPDKVAEYIRNNNIDISDGVNCDDWQKRYIGEGLPGMIFKNVEHCLSIGGPFSLTSARSHKDYMERNCKPNELHHFNSLFGEFFNFTNING